MRWIRKLWWRLTRRSIWVELDQIRTQASIGRLDQALKRGYYIKLKVKRVGEDWEEIVVFPIQIKDSSGKVIALRVTRAMMFPNVDFSEVEPYYLDRPDFGVGSPPPESPTDRA